jgi:hypothetical protein
MVTCGRVYGTRLLCVVSKHWAEVLRSGNYDAVEHFHGFNGDIAKYGADVFPKFSFGTGHFPGSLEKGTGQLLNLVSQESQEHERQEYQAEILLAETEVVLAMVSLVLQCVESLVFHLPSSAASAHDGVGVFLRDREIRNPTEVLCAAGAFFPVFQDIDQKILVGGVDGDTVHKPKEMVDFGILWILDVVYSGLTFFNSGVETR